MCVGRMEVVMYTREGGRLKKDELLEGRTKGSDLLPPTMDNLPQIYMHTS